MPLSVGAWKGLSWKVTIEGTSLLTGSIWICTAPMRSSFSWMGGWHPTNGTKLMQCVCGHTFLIQGSYWPWSWGYMVLPFSSQLLQDWNNSLCVNLINMGNIYTSFIFPTLSNTLSNAFTCFISFNPPDNPVRFTIVFSFCRWGNWDKNWRLVRVTQPLNTQNQGANSDFP